MVFHQAIIRVRAGSRLDRGGNTVADWSPENVDRLTVGRVSVQPIMQSETATPERTAAVTGWRVISEPGVDADIRYNDRIEWDGMTLEIVGEVARYLDFVHSTPHHIEFAMRRKTG
ncbi:hypothetical protein J7E97_08195 [Streptomyces sp. ISL-66]|uniref:hypothetical protein n=1 Tax=Streptomyces sp. ISL-66 TaxID=2819186 RepID=UPI001BE97FEC|nr:hypothetical protein [Streptomyces sp. ISL-66]MBT2467854.1 hypothetical protein [Streptomyces sp. ISL-66]